MPRSVFAVLLCCLHLFFNTTNLILHVWLSSDNNSDCQLPICSSPAANLCGETGAKTKAKDLRAEYKSAIGN